MKVALIDDEEDARKTLRHFLSSLQPWFEIQEANGVVAGLELIQSFQPELVFLDVMMSDGTGFDLLKQLPTISFKLVIVSGHQNLPFRHFGLVQLITW